MLNGTRTIFGCRLAAEVSPSSQAGAGPDTSPTVKPVGAAGAGPEPAVGLEPTVVDGSRLGGDPRRVLLLRGGAACVLCLR